MSPRARAARIAALSEIVFGYVRVSTTRQGESGLGLDAQTVAIAHARPGAVIVSEVASAGGGKDRPVLAELLDRLDREGGTLVVAKLDRLARSVVDFGNILTRAQRHGWALVVADLGVDTATPHGRLTAHILASVAEFERDMIAARQRDSHASKRARNVASGRRSNLDADVSTAIETMRTTGASWAAIAEHLNRQGTTTPTGRVWTRESVRAASVAGDADRAAKRRAARAQGLAA